MALCSFYNNIMSMWCIKKLAEKMPIYFEHFKRESIKIIRSSSFAKNTKEISHTVSTNQNVFFVVRTN